jgi:hypothetical protein
MYYSSTELEQLYHQLRAKIRCLIKRANRISLICLRGSEHKYIYIYIYILDWDLEGDVHSMWIFVDKRPSRMQGQFVF